MGNGLCRCTLIGLACMCLSTPSLHPHSPTTHPPARFGCSTPNVVCVLWRSTTLIRWWGTGKGCMHTVNELCHAVGHCEMGNRNQAPPSRERLGAAQQLRIVGMGSRIHFSHSTPGNGNAWCAHNAMATITCIGGFGSGLLLTQIDIQ